MNQASFCECCETVAECGHVTFFGGFKARLCIECMTYVQEAVKATISGDYAAVHDHPMEMKRRAFELARKVVKGR